MSIAGTSYNYSFNTNNAREKNIFFFNGHLDMADNLAGLVTKPKQVFSEKIADAYFAQYVKTDIEMRYSRKLSTDVYWSNRLNIGIGIPYGNSSYLPFTRQFLKDIAVDGGIGIRLDINVLIIRLDMGIPFRKPWLPRGSEWVIDQISFGNSSWRKDNIVWNIGIGYPF